MSENIEVSIQDERWEIEIADVENFVIRSLAQALIQLKIAHYKPIVSVALADDSLLHDLNLRYRSKDNATNVLSFSYNELSQDCYLGDVVISFDTICRESLEYNRSFKNHALHMLVHGLLHILGHDHELEADEAKMRKLEVEILSSLGVNDPYDA